jgi:hypothetical protein
LLAVALKLLTSLGLKNDLPSFDSFGEKREKIYQNIKTQSESLHLLELLVIDVFLAQRAALAFV